jgi:hypothetical protein
MAERPAGGLRTYNYRLRTDEFGEFDGMRITTVARTGFDIARRRSLDAAIANLDALGNATGLQNSDILRIAREHRGSRGLCQLAKVLDLYDPGAASPKEKWLRLWVIRADYPRPETQIPVLSPDGRRRYYLDMGWREKMLALEYDGEQHRLDPYQYVYDIRRSEDLYELGWTRLRVVKTNPSADILRRLARLALQTAARSRELLKWRSVSRLEAPGMQSQWAVTPAVR